MNLTHEDDWRQHAACRGMKPALFYPARGEDARQALAVCATCTVRTECLEAALAEEHSQWTAGVRGGMSAKQRRALRKQRNAA